MSTTRTDELKAKLMKGGMMEYHAAMAAGILAAAEPGPSETARRHVEQRKAAAEGLRLLDAQSAAWPPPERTR